MQNPSEWRIVAGCRPTGPDCEQPLGIAVIDTQPSTTSLLFHSLVPAAQWCDDIVFT